jgi:hypothetical protein
MFCFFFIPKYELLKIIFRARLFLKDLDQRVKQYAFYILLRLADVGLSTLDNAVHKDASRGC